MAKKSNLQTGLNCPDPAEISEITRRYKQIVLARVEEINRYLFSIVFPPRREDNGIVKPIFGYNVDNVPTDNYNFRPDRQTRNPGQGSLVR